jgi:hypothetical protein
MKRLTLAKNVSDEALNASLHHFIASLLLLLSFASMTFIDLADSGC